MCIKVSKPVFNYYKSVFLFVEKMIRSRYVYAVDVPSAQEMMNKIEAKFSREALIGMVVQGFELNLPAQKVATDILSKI